MPRPEQSLTQAWLAQSSPPQPASHSHSCCGGVPEGSPRAGGTWLGFGLGLGLGLGSGFGLGFGLRLRIGFGLGLGLGLGLGFGLG